MAMVMDVLREGQIRDVREEVYTIVAETDRLARRVSGVDGITVIANTIRGRFQTDFFCFNLTINQMESLIAIFCSEIYVVYDPATQGYALDILYDAALRDNIELSDNDAYKLKVVGMEGIDGGVTEIDFNDVRRELILRVASSMVHTPSWDDDRYQNKFGHKVGFCQRIVNHFRRK